MRACGNYPDFFQGNIYSQLLQARNHPLVADIAIPYSFLQGLPQLRMAMVNEQAQDV